MSSKISPHRSNVDDLAHENSLRDSELCQRILGIDLSIRAVAIIEESTVTGFALTARTNNILGLSSDLREKIGIWTRLVTEIGRQTEQMFGELESITYKLGKLKLVTIPLSKTRSLGFSLDKSADENSVLARILTRLDLKSPRNR